MMNNYWLQQPSCRSPGGRNHISPTPPRSNNQHYTGPASLCLDTHFPRDISDKMTELWMTCNIPLDIELDPGLWRYTLSRWDKGCR